jgi:hypothetical protein
MNKHCCFLHHSKAIPTQCKLLPFFFIPPLNLSSVNVGHGFVKIGAVGAMAISFSRAFTFLTEFFRAIFKVVAKMAVAKPIPVHF